MLQIGCARPTKALKNMVLAQCLLLLFGSSSLAQNAIIKGKVINPTNRSIPGVVVEVLGLKIISKTDNKGQYRLVVPVGRHLVRFSHPVHQDAQLEIEAKAGYTYDRPIKMLEITLDESVITNDRDPLDDPPQMQLFPIEAEEILKMPSFNRSVEGVMKSMPGVASNNEFSSQYQVRGGNFDENLVYVNGIEIYRPFLTRSGQQEGLGFTNPDMVENIQFSTGGFQAQYGDKMSSVLDITYRRPRKFRLTAEAGLINTSVHAEGVSRNKDPQKRGRFTYSLGARRFNTTYLLNSLETRGEYRPNFIDGQAMFTFTPRMRKKQTRIREMKNGQIDTLYYANDRLRFTSFFAVTRNRYIFEPSSRTSTFGTIQQALRVRTAFEGREISSYLTSLGAIMATHRPNSRLKFDYIFTAFNTQENELFDIEGGYLLGEVNTSFGSEEFNASDFDLGVGTEYNHARNFLTANVLAGQVRGQWQTSNSGKHTFHFGLKGEVRLIEDELKEYYALDSAGYVIDPLSNFDVQEFIKGTSKLQANTYKGFLQHNWRLDQTKLLVSGLRVVHDDLINETMISPRFQFVYDASRKKGGKDIRLRLATGVYQQAPFYREFRRLDGSLNLDIKPQRSVHLIGGLDYQFYAWNRPFKLFSEIYYKQLYDLIPYEVQNVRIRYYPDQVANGYAYGWDARISGEFIKGVESWLSLGVLKTEENIVGDGRGFVPRPTDQRVTFSMFFQDELPIDPTFKVHVNYVFGSGLRFGPPRVFENRTAFDFPSYQRADIGFSKLITFRSRAERKRNYGLESLWATVEIFNLFQRENTVSYIWIEDLNNNQYAVPNYLSARLINIRLIMKLR